MGLTLCFNFDDTEDYTSFFKEECDHSNSLHVADVIYLSQLLEVLKQLNVLQRYEPPIMHTLSKSEEPVIRSHMAIKYMHVSEEKCQQT